MKRIRLMVGLVAALVLLALLSLAGWSQFSGRSGEQDRDGKSDQGGGGAVADPFGTTAAERFGWGTPVGGSEFTDPHTLEGEEWEVFSGAGYQNKGRQRRDAVKVIDGGLVINGNRRGDTGAVGYYGAVQHYGRWESRIRIPSGDGSYHPVALLWPSSEKWPEDGEIDYFEATGSADKSSFSIHHGAGEPDVTEISIDREWHTYAVEWTPTSITAYYDGHPYYETTDTSLFPPGPMWHSFQLDWMAFAGSEDNVMEVDWLRIYRLFTEESGSGV